MSSNRTESRVKETQVGRASDIYEKIDRGITRLTGDFTGWEADNAKFAAEFEKIVLALRSDDGTREPPPDPKL